MAESSKSVPKGGELPYVWKFERFREQTEEDKKFVEELLEEYEEWFDPTLTETEKSYEDLSLIALGAADDLDTALRKKFYIEMYKRDECPLLSDVDEYMTYEKAVVAKMEVAERRALIATAEVDRQIRKDECWKIDNYIVKKKKEINAFTYKKYVPCPDVNQWSEVQLNNLLGRNLKRYREAAKVAYKWIEITIPHVSMKWQTQVYESVTEIEEYDVTAFAQLDVVYEQWEQDLTPLQRKDRDVIFRGYLMQEAELLNVNLFPKSVLPDETAQDIADRFTLAYPQKTYYEKERSADYHSKSQEDKEKEDEELQKRGPCEETQFEFMNEMKTIAATEYYQLEIALVCLRAVVLTDNFLEAPYASRYCEYRKLVRRKSEITSPFIRKGFSPLSRFGILDRSAFFSGIKNTCVISRVNDLFSPIGELLKRFYEWRDGDRDFIPLYHRKFMSYHANRLAFRKEMTYFNVASEIEKMELALRWMRRQVPLAELWKCVKLPMPEYSFLTWKQVKKSLGDCWFVRYIGNVDDWFGKSPVVTSDGRRLIYWVLRRDKGNRGITVNKWWDRGPLRLPFSEGDIDYFLEKDQTYYSDSEMSDADLQTKERAQSREEYTQMLVEKKLVVVTRDKENRINAYIDDDALMTFFKTTTPPFTGKDIEGKRIWAFAFAKKAKMRSAERTKNYKDNPYLVLSPKMRKTNETVFARSPNLTQWQLTRERLYQQHFPDVSLSGTGMGGGMDSNELGAAILSWTPELIALYAGDSPLTPAERKYALSRVWTEMCATAHKHDPKIRSGQRPLNKQGDRLVHCFQCIMQIETKVLLYQWFQIFIEHRTSFKFSDQLTPQNIPSGTAPIYRVATPKDYAFFVGQKRKTNPAKPRNKSKRARSSSQSSAPKVVQSKKPKKNDTPVDGSGFNLLCDVSEAILEGNRHLQNARGDIMTNRFGQKLLVNSEQGRMAVAQKLPMTSTSKGVSSSRTPAVVPDDDDSSCEEGEIVSVDLDLVISEGSDSIGDIEDSGIIEDTRDNEEIADPVTHMQRKHQAFKDKMADLTEKCLASLRPLLKGHEEQLDKEMKSHSDSIVQELEQVKAQNQTIQAQLTKAANDLKVANSQAQLYVQKSSLQWRLQVKVLKNENDKQKTDITSLKDESQKLTAEINEVKVEKQKSEDQVAQLKQENQKLRQWLEANDLGHLIKGMDAAMVVEPSHDKTASEAVTTGLGMPDIKNMSSDELEAYATEQGYNLKELLEDFVVQPTPETAVASSTEAAKEKSDAPAEKTTVANPKKKSKKNTPKSK